MNCHDGVVNRLLWMKENYGFSSGDVFLQKTPFSFDVSVWEFFLPVLCGARLVFAKPDGHKDPAYLARMIREHGVTTVHFVPSMLQSFVDDVKTRELPSLKRVICSGEALPAALQRRFFAAFPGSELHNLYGPTEAAVDVTYWACRRDADDATVPIGRPVWNTQIHILDEFNNPVPVGIPGELYIGGIQVGRGYWCQPEVTQSRFIEDAFTASPHARLYKTVDRAKFQKSGAIEFLGRNDRQVKLRGYRIELDEIASALESIPGVLEVAVKKWSPGEAPGVNDAFLVAYYSSKTGERLELREPLRQLLPEFAIPSYFVRLDRLPLSANGKLQVSALTPPAPAAESNRPVVAATNEIERLLLEIWHDVLVRSDIGVTDGFFDVGGHSLLLIRVQFRIQQALKRDLPLLDLFKYPTIAGLARALSDGGGDGDADGPARNIKNRSEARRQGVRRIQQSRKRE
jgi:acyl-coenzyme A synthetase/AMP-(fatty) acid ligase